MICHRSERGRPVEAALFFLIAVGLLLSSGTAGAATLAIEGKPGTAVFLNEEPLGFLPLTAPLDLPAGMHVVRAEQRGMETLSKQVLLSEDSVVRLQLRLVPLSRRDAITYSFLLAGTGQRYLGRSNLGWALTVTEVFGLMTALISEAQYQNNHDDYLVAYDNYLNSIGNNDIIFWRNQADAAWSDMDRAESRRNTAMLVAGGAVLVSVLDSWLRFPGMETGPGPVPPTGAARLAGGGEGMHVCWKISF